MPTLQTRPVSHQHATPPSNSADHPLTPPPTDEKPFSQAQRVITLFKAIQAGRHTKQDPWTEFQLAPGDYDEIERRLGRDEALSGYVKDKIQYDYNANVNQLIVRMPTAIHELFVARVEDAIFSQLKSIREGAGAAAAFAQKVEPARSTEIYLLADDALPGTKSKYEPDASFWHSDAEYPGVIFEIAYSQKKKKLGRLAEDYLLDSDANVQAVVGFDIEYGKKGSRKATLSVWRTHVFNTTSGNELRVVQEAVDETFRDDDGSPTNHPGLRLHLSDFAHKGLVQDEIGDYNQELIVSTEQLCRFLTAAEVKVRQRGSLSKDSLAPGIKKRKRSQTPPEEITSGDEARYVEQEERAAKRMADDDSDYESTLIRNIS
ncbi:hypothetical protein P154DRAFT_519687 [Amniculicola lignicola CBS 123094]|uniref:Uncharacterized protein n=1 Tax=Amniculicola lignicola CBS 123094 TaxID=1392246 RepID=A0A6A5WTP0_9PLEO|nr:hypothetical protein P154DRAFT_519687 [Amniculicola lignicola CBS 123094]